MSAAPQSPTTRRAFLRRAGGSVLAGSLAGELEFGLAAASDRSTGHFPGISSEVPLCVQAAAQDATASFSAEGFVAAAVTAMAMMAGAAMPRGTAKQLTASFDRPFGFVAVDRSTGLVLICGWVEEPENYPR